LFEIEAELEFDTIKMKKAAKERFCRFFMLKL